MLHISQQTPRKLGICSNSQFFWIKAFKVSHSILLHFIWFGLFCFTWFLFSILFYFKILFKSVFLYFPVFISFYWAIQIALPVNVFSGPFLNLTKERCKCWAYSLFYGSSERWQQTLNWSIKSFVLSFLLNSHCVESQIWSCLQYDYCMSW